MFLRESGVATGGSATTLVAATYPFLSSRTDGSNRMYEGAELYIEEAGYAGTPNPNDIASYVRSTGTFTVGNSYATESPASADDFSIFLRGVRRQQIKDAINLVLRNAHFLTWAPLSFVVDGDMDTAGTSDWTATNATHTKVTNTNLRHGPQASRVLATAANGQIASTAILVDPTYARDWYVTALVRAQVGTARLIAYDNTNAANITTQDWTNQGWGRIGFQFQLPATCESLLIVLRSVANSDDCYWDDVCAYPLGVSEFPLPSWVIRRDQVLDVRDGMDTSPADRADEMRTRHIPYVIQDDFSNPNSQHKLVFPDYTTGTGPLWLRAHRQYPALSADADTTFMDREHLVLAAEVALLEKLIARPASEEVTAWKNLLYGSGPRPGKRAQLAALNRRMNPINVEHVA